MNHKRILLPVVLVLTAAILTSAAAAGTTRAATVKLQQTSLGQILANSHGKTLYLFAHDKGRKSTCYGACAAYWPPLITKGTPRAGAGVRKALLGTTRRRDGRLQVTYHGHPRYRFSGDTSAGDTTGEGLTDFGGVWDAVSPAGLAAQGGTGGPGYLRRSLFAHQKLEHGLLRIAGTPGSDKIALRLEAGDPNTLQVDFGDDGSPDFSFDRTEISRISVAAGPGDDAVRIDESNGVFTDTIPTRIDGGPG